MLSTRNARRTNYRTLPIQPAPMPQSEPNSQGQTPDAAAASAAGDCVGVDRPSQDQGSSATGGTNPQVVSAESLAAAVDALRTETGRLAAVGEALARAQHEWVEKHRWLDESCQRTQRSRRKLAARLWRLRRQKREWCDLSSGDGGATGRLPEAAEAELQMLRSQLAEAATMLEQLRDSKHHGDDGRALRGDDVEDEFRDELESLRGELHSLLTQDDDSDSSGSVAKLRDQLTAERIRCEELESQNASLAALVATSQVHDQISGTANSESLESLSWEQRKAAILYQLNREDHDEPIDAGERESLREAVARTDREIHRRDNEIAELRQLLESQSTTLGGSVAVGAAAIAEMIDADELVREEREKLKTIRSEWQEKLRKAEIDLSLERAKLARERRELEQKHAELEDQLALAANHSAGANAPEQPRRRRWMTQLGLSETEGE